MSHQNSVRVQNQQFGLPPGLHQRVRCEVMIVLVLAVITYCRAFYGKGDEALKARLEQANAIVQGALANLNDVLKNRIRTQITRPPPVGFTIGCTVLFP